MRLVEQGDCFRKSRIEFRSEEFRCCAVCSGRFCAGCSSRRAGATAGWHLCSDHHLLWHCSIHLGGRRSQTLRPNIPIPRHGGEGPSAFLLPRAATQQGSATTEPSPAPPKRFGDRNIFSELFTSITCLEKSSPSRYRQPLHPELLPVCPRQRVGQPGSPDRHLKASLVWQVPSIIQCFWLKFKSGDVSVFLLPFLSDFMKHRLHRYLSGLTHSSPHFGQRADFENYMKKPISSFLLKTYIVRSKRITTY